MRVGIYKINCQKRMDSLDTSEVSEVNKQFIHNFVDYCFSEGLAEALFTRGYIYSKNNRYNEALNYFDRVLELNPYDQKALTKKAFVYSCLGRNDEALEAIEEEALAISRYNPKTWYWGFIHYNLGEYEEALRAFNKSA